MKIVEKAAFQVIGIKVTATWDELWTEVPKAWKTLFANQEQIRHRIGETFLDISLKQEGDHYLEFVGAEVSVIEQVPLGMEALEIPAQRYITQRHVGPLADIGITYGQIYEWAKEHNLAVDEFKIDRGYTVDHSEEAHDLFVRLI